jgi:hypothetical protein
MVAATSRHAEIAVRYKRGKRQQGAVVFTALRLKELGRLLHARYGPELPDDDAGRDDAFIVANHLAVGRDAEQRIRQWLSLWAPWMASTEIGDIISRTTAKPYRWRADSLGAALGLTEAERQRLAIRTIGAVGVTKEDRARRRLEAKRIREQRRRRDKGAKARAEYEENSVSRRKPWEAMGMKRRSWYRAGRPTP